MRFSTARLVALALLFSVGAGANAQTATPDFSKAFSPSTIGPGSVTALTFTIDNATNAAASNLAFTDVLPAGMTLATPSNASTSCTSSRGGTVVLTAPDGGTAVSLSGASLPASESCEVTVNVTSATPGVSTNTSGDLTSSLGNSGPATADLTVDTGLPGFSKGFAPATVVLGGRSTLTFTIDNTANPAAVNTLDFTDNFPSGMVVASPANASTTCGTATIPPTLTAVAGATSVTLDADGFSTFPAVAAGASCTVTVDVETTGAGALGNVSQDLLANFNSAGKASAVLDVVASTLQLSKSFLQDPVPPGGTVPLSFTLRNISRDGTATGLAFTDDLDAALSGLLATGSLPATVCNGGTLSSPDGGMTLEFSGGTLAVSESCTFEIDVTVPAGAATGGYTNVTSGIEGEVDGSPAAGREATAPLFVDTVPVLTKTFLDNPVTPGADVTLEFSITNTNPGFAASDITFTDELSASFPLGTVVTQTNGDPLPATDVCGTGSSLTQVSLGVGGEGLQLSMGALAAGETCTFGVIIETEATLAGGEYVNTTSDISALINGATKVGAPATDVLSVLDGPQLVKEFTDDPVVPGGTVTLEFTLDFPSEGSLAASGIAFSDDLDATLSGLAATGLPIAACGGTLSSADFGATLDFTGGTLSPGDECAFSVSLAVPATAGSGTYPNTTTALTSTVGGVALTGATASDDLAVTDLQFAKAFLDDPVAPGADVTLEFTLTNGSASLPMTDVAFTDDLDAVIVGLAATAIPPSPVCGGTLSSLGGGQLLVFTGGSLAAGETCAFSVTLGVPASAEPGLYSNVTSVVSATFNGGTITAAPAADGLAISDVVPPTLSAAFAPAFISPGGVSQLTLTVDNGDSVDPASALAVTASLAAGIEVASPANAASTCGGTVTAVDGGSSLELAGGTVAAGATCTVSVSVTGASLGMFLANTTVLSSSAGTSNAASAKLTIEEPADIVVTKADALDDTDGDTFADTGETIAYTVVIAPTGAVDRTSTFTDTPDANTTLVPGSVSVDAGGTIVSGNGPGEGTLVVTFEDLAQTATIAFEVVVGAYPEEAVEACNQGTLSGDFEPVLSDDPDVVGGGATCTALAPPNDPPVAVAAADQETAECTGAAGAAFVLDGSGSSDPDGDALTYSWSGPFGTVTGVSPTVTLPLGESTVTLTVTDPSGETDTDEIVLTVEDTVGPVLTVGASSVVLWPPNHRYETIALGDLGLAVADVCDAGLTAADVVVTQVSSDEPENGSGDGNTVDDIVVAATCDAVDVRVERKGNGNGRVYAIDLGVADASGNVGTATYEAAVPKNQNSTAVRDAAAYTVFGCPAAPAAVLAEGTTAPGSGEEVATAVAPPSRVIPEAFALGTTYPNPMDRSAHVRYDVPVASAVRLEVYDTLGRQVAVLVDGTVEAGSHEAVFYAHRLPAGTYLVRFTSAEGFAQTRPVTVLR